MDTARYRITPGTKVRLSEIDPREKTLFPLGKIPARSLLDSLNARLQALQALLYADRTQKVLVVLQGRNASGKDGTIRHVFDGVNPQGVRVVSFKTPSAHEASHDYLWRIHAQCPAAGELVIFNRSHYEDILVPRVARTLPKRTWKRRYQQIVDFERMLVEEGTTILKFFLHISREEQRERFEARLERREKRWKLDAADLEQRAQWDAYTDAYEEILSCTSTEHAPWHVIPADRKWYRNLVVSKVLVDALEALEMRWPEPKLDPSKVDLG
ncbi:MAG: polyphosphate kinase 2 family protein [Deltaproteobacteria bacterium]|nr:MAG: polyphosphate kinase 2 family protein [Deltaproteobacteria bacterium]